MSSRHITRAGGPRTRVTAGVIGNRRVMGVGIALLVNRIERTPKLSMSETLCYPNLIASFDIPLRSW